MKTFYSAEDIEALAGQGVTELRVDEETVITHLAKDTAQRLGIVLVYGAPGSPVSRRGSTLAPSPRRGSAGETRTKCMCPHRVHAMASWR